MVTLSRNAFDYAMRQHQFLLLKVNKPISLIGWKNMNGYN